MVVVVVDVDTVLSARDVVVVYGQMSRDRSEVTQLS